MIHFHMTFLDGKTVTVRNLASCETGRECTCEGGEEQLFHDAVEAGEVDKQCPCADCQAGRNKRFLAWQKQQEKARVTLV